MKLLQIWVDTIVYRRIISRLSVTIYSVYNYVILFFIWAGEGQGLQYMLSKIKKWWDGERGRDREYF